MEYHKLLQRQIKKHFTDEMLKDPELNKFITSINDSYNSFDRDKEIIEHAFTVSENEYSEVNYNLQKEVILKRISIQMLKDALKKMDSSGQLNVSETEDDILSIVEYLNVQIERQKQMEGQLILQEEKYRNIIANMNLGLLEVDNNDIIQFVNQSFCHMSGYSFDELIGQKGSLLMMSEKDREIMSSKDEIRKAGTSDLYSLQIKNKSGEPRWWVISGAPRFNDSGELVGSVGVHLDITEQKNLEHELKIAKQKAEESSKAKESFLATMSHEIRTPLNAIVGITDLMRMNLKSRNNENLEILSFSSKNLLALITDILDLSKIDAGKIDLCANPIDIKLLIKGTLQTFKPACEEKSVELIVDIDSSVPDTVTGDELRPSQILNNLISNAIKFTPKGFVKVVVRSYPIENEKNRFDFKIIDSGIGIKKDKLKSVFNDFEQADSEIVRHYGGTGLGLSITKKLVELHGGTISIESKFNVGTTFSFFIDYAVPKEKIKSIGAGGFGKQDIDVIVHKYVFIFNLLSNLCHLNILVPLLHHQ